MLGKREREDASRLKNKKKKKKVEGVAGRGVLLRGRGKSAIKEALKPLAGYWSRPSDSDHKPGSHIQADVPVMGFSEFKMKARRLLTDAGLLVSQLNPEE